MSDARLFVSWPMDCEPINAEVPSGGPADWALSERAMRGYVSALAERGHRATLFLYEFSLKNQPSVKTAKGCI